MSVISTYVLICTYNGERYIMEQVKSIINQTVPISRIYLYDFGSSDNTNKLIAELQNKYTCRIYVHHFKYTGNVANSFLRALNDISDKIPINSLLYICDQDDYWLPNKNEHILSLSYDFDIPIIFHHDVYLVNKNLDNLNCEFYTDNLKCFLTKSISHRSKISTIIGHTICMNFNSVKLLAAIDYDERIIMHDWLWGAIVEAYGKVIFLNKKLSYYRQHECNVLGARIEKSNKLDSIINTYKLWVLVSRQYAYIKSLGVNNKNNFYLIFSLFFYKNFKEALSVFVIGGMNFFLLFDSSKRI